MSKPNLPRANQPERKATQQLREKLKSYISVSPNKGHEKGCYARSVQPLKGELTGTITFVFNQEYVSTH